MPSMIDLLRRQTAAREFLLAQTEIPTCSEITRVEVLQGIHSPQRQAAETLFDTFNWAVVDERITRRAGELGRRFRRSHPGPGVADLLIGATAATPPATLSRWPSTSDPSPATTFATCSTWASATSSRPG